MATNLLIGFPDIPASAVEFYPSTTTYPFGYENTIRGPRYTAAKFASGTNHEIVYGLGGDYTALDNKAQFLILTRADVLQSMSVTTVKLQSDTTSAFGAPTNHVNDTSFSSKQLYGPYSEDTFYTFSLSSAFQWWRIQFTTSSSQALRVCKVYFGQWFDMGKDPEAPIDIEPFHERPTRVVWPSGTQQQDRTTRALYRFRVRWEGITDATVQAFNNKINRYKHINQLYLYTDTVHALLGGYRIVHCRISEVEVVGSSRVNDWNTVTAVFEELPTR